MARMKAVRRKPPIPKSKTPLLPARSDKVFGLRERNKRDKLRRIKDAATELFMQKGFDDTTTRAIALHAGVGLGTVFIYAPTKRDLLFLIINEELQAEVDRAAALVQESRPMLDNLVRIFRAHYRHFGERPALSRLALREMMFYATGPEAQKFLTTRERLIALIERVVTIAIDRKEIAPRDDAKLIAWVIFSLYQIEIRHWLMTEELDLAKGVDFLKRQLVLLVDGLSPAHRTS
jgi:AcrR family transcriptional regulator